MSKERKRARRLRIIIWSFIAVPLFLFVVSFWGDLGQTLAYMWNVLVWLLIGRNQPFAAPTPEQFHAIQITLFTVFIGGAGSFLLWLLLISFQAILPVETLSEVFNTAGHQIIYLLGQHGPAVFVQEGKILDPEEELTRPGPGVLVVNFNSALVLEREVGRTGCLMMPSILIRSFFSWMTKTPSEPMSRVAGPGVVFKAADERIRDVVDLRKQSRASKGKISAYTRDGIELGSVVFVVFTIGQEPETLELAYSGGRRPENLRIISTKKVGGNRIEIKTLEDDDLDPEDRAAAHEYARIPNQSRDAKPFSLLPPWRLEPEFDEKRVFKAVYAKALSPQEKPEPWTELPARVGADVFRNLMSTINYDDLYNLHDATPGSFPIPRIKKRFKGMVRNLGLLNFRIVFHRELKPLPDGTYNEADLRASPSIPFTASRVLRDRGIKVIIAGFNSPTPVSDEIYKQRLATWRAEWEHDTEIKRAEKELEELRVRNHAHAQAQRSLSQALSQIFEDGEGTDEVMALRVLQALEGIAADPKTRQLLPGETIDMMNHLHHWLLPANLGSIGANSMLPPGAVADPEANGGLPPGFVPPANLPPPPPGPRLTEE